MKLRVTGNSSKMNLVMLLSILGWGCGKRWSNAEGNVIMSLLNMMEL